MHKSPQLLAEAIFPLLGYYFWDWSWYFILLFYVLDAFAKEAILNVQSNKIYKTQGGDGLLRTWKISAAKSMFIGLGTVLLLHLLQFYNHPAFSFSTEMGAFLQHKEMGIAQGLIIVPLVFVNVWMQYKLHFLKFNLHVKTKLSEMWSKHIQYRLFVLSIVALGFGVTTFVQVNDHFMLWTAVLLPFIYVQFFKKGA